MLGLDAMWQLVGFYLGWLGKPGKGRALGGTVKFTGEVIKKYKEREVRNKYEKNFEKGGTTVGLANGILSADGKKYIQQKV